MDCMAMIEEAVMQAAATAVVLTGSEYNYWLHLVLSMGWTGLETGFQSPVLEASEIAYDMAIQGFDSLS